MVEVMAELEGALCVARESQAAWRDRALQVGQQEVACWIGIAMPTCLQHPKLH